MRSWQERLWRSVDKSGGPDACWFWTLSVEGCGYGQMKRLVDGKKVTRHTHRLAYEDTHGHVPRLLRHLCSGRYAPGDISYRRCCNPAHLAPGTQKQNMLECAAEGRQRGTDGGVKLTEAQVLAIRAERAEGASWRQLAKKFGVAPTTVKCIVLRESWKHLP